MLYSKTMLLTFFAGLLLTVKSHVGDDDATELILGDVRIEDMWCFDPAYNVGVPNLYKRLQLCLQDPVENSNECDLSLFNFCKVNGIDLPECQRLKELAKENSFACRNTLLFAFSTMETRLGECSASESYKIWESHLLTDSGGPHHYNELVNKRRRLAKNSLTYEVGDSHSIARKHNVANYMHQAIDKVTALTDVDCIQVQELLKKAVDLAFLGNLRIGTLNAADVNGKTYEELYHQFEGHAVVNHGDIEMHYTPSAFWDLFNGVAISSLPSHIHCNMKLDVDGKWRNACHRDPWTKHY